MLIAATSQRLLLFELTVRTVHRYQFIRHDAIQYVRPPKPGLLGTTGRVRFGLESGHEYQMGFLGPLLDEEAMQQERRLAAWFHRLGERIPPSPADLPVRRRAA